MKCKTCKTNTIKTFDDGNCQSCHQKAYKKAYRKTDKYKAYKKAYYLRVTKPKIEKETKKK